MWRCACCSPWGSPAGRRAWRGTAGTSPTGSHWATPTASSTWRPPPRASTQCQARRTRRCAARTVPRCGSCGCRLLSCPCSATTPPAAPPCAPSQLPRPCCDTSGRGCRIYGPILQMSLRVASRPMLRCLLLRLLESDCDDCPLGEWPRVTLRLLDALAGAMAARRLPCYFLPGLDLLLHAPRAGGGDAAVCCEEDSQQDAGVLRGFLQQLHTEARLAAACGGSEADDDEEDPCSWEERVEAVVVGGWDWVERSLGPPPPRRRHAADHYSARQLDYIALLLRSLLRAKQLLVHADGRLPGELWEDCRGEGGAVVGSGGGSGCDPREELAFLVCTVARQARRLAGGSGGGGSCGDEASLWALAEQVRRHEAAGDLREDAVMVRELLHLLHRSQPESALRTYLRRLFLASCCIPWLLEFNMSFDTGSCPPLQVRELLRWLHRAQPESALRAYLRRLFLASSRNAWLLPQWRRRCADMERRSLRAFCAQVVQEACLSLPPAARRAALEAVRRASRSASRAAAPRARTLPPPASAPRYRSTLHPGPSDDDVDEQQRRQRQRHARSLTGPDTLLGTCRAARRRHRPDLLPAAHHTTAPAAHLAIAAPTTVLGPRATSLALPVLHQTPDRRLELRPRYLPAKLTSL